VSLATLDSSSDQHYLALASNGMVFGCGSCIALLVIALTGTMVVVIRAVSRQRERSRSQQMRAGLQRGKVYRISRDGVELGAWGSADILSMLSTKQLLPSDHCWSEGMTERKPISEVFPAPAKPKGSGQTI